MLKAYNPNENAHFSVHDFFYFIFLTIRNFLIFIKSVVVGISYYFQNAHFHYVAEFAP